MTFEDRIRKRRRWGIVAVVAAILLLALLSFALLWALYITTPAVSGMPWVGWLLVYSVNVVLAFGVGWAARSFIIESIDVQVRDWGPLQRKLFAAAIEQEERNGRKGGEG